MQRRSGCGRASADIARRFACSSLPRPCSLPSACRSPPPSLPAPPPEQAAQYRAEMPKTILELQQFRRSQSIAAEGAGGRRGRATLIELNPYINAWFLLTLDWGDPAGRRAFISRTRIPAAGIFALTPPSRTVCSSATTAATTNCDLWSGDPSALERAAPHPCLTRRCATAASTCATRSPGIAPTWSGSRIPARSRLGRRGDRRLRARPAVPRRLSRAGRRPAPRPGPRASPRAPRARRR